MTQLVNVPNEDALAALQSAQRELADLRWQVDQANVYGTYMRNCVRPVTFAEWIRRRRALLASLSEGDAQET